MMARTIKLIILLLFVLVVVNVSAKRKTKKGLVLRQKETNLINFIRLSVMRLVYGLASRFGYEDQISEFMNGALVPPGVDEYGDYDAAGLFSREDYDY